MSDGTRWQNVLLIIRGEQRRLECPCGALAVIVSGVIADTANGDSTSDAYNCMKSANAWCQTCFVNAQSSEDEDE